MLPPPQGAIGGAALHADAPQAGGRGGAQAGRLTSGRVAKRRARRRQPHPARVSLTASLNMYCSLKLLLIA